MAKENHTRPMSHNTAQGTQYGVTCTVHGIKRWFDGAVFGPKESARRYASKSEALRVAADSAYPCEVEPLP